MSTIVVFSMFVTSFMPLWISILIIEFLGICDVNNSNKITEIVCVSVIVLLNLMSFLLLKNWLKKAGKSASEELVVVEAKENKTISAEYLLSYILPLFAFDFKTWHSVILFLVFFCTLAFVCVRHNYISLNIVLEMMGYSQYDCLLKKEDVDTEISRIVITKEHLKTFCGRLIKINHLNNEIGLMMKADDPFF